MRVAALYDIHGNLPALEAVLAEIEGEHTDLIVVGGDVVAGPMPLQVLERLVSSTTSVQFILGNADAEVLLQMEGKQVMIPRALLPMMDWVARQLKPVHRELMRAWPLTAQLEIEGLGRVLLCHATPRNNTDVFTRLTPEARLLPVFEGVQAAVVVCGRTHMQFDRVVGGVRVVNAGSVGMPYGQPGAHWLRLGPDLERRRTPYALEQAARRVRASGVPGAERIAQENILRSPSEEEALSVFEPMTLA